MEDPNSKEQTNCDIMREDVKDQVSSSVDRFRSSGELPHSDSRRNEDKPRVLMTKTEEEVGITEFLDTSEAFTGITKHRWSDFIVHEITPSGDVVVLTDTQRPEEDKEDPQDKVRPEWFPESLWEQITALSKAASGTGQVTIPAASFSKDERTNYHKTIKNGFPDMVTNTGEVNGEKSIIVKKANSRPDKNNTFWKHKPWPKSRPRFLHLTLFKENVDTFAALSMLSLDMKLRSNKFHMAGTKDARAKTTQRVAIKQTEAVDVWKAASKFDKLAVGNFSYHDAELKLGDLQGNQFDIVLRHVQGSDDVIRRRVTSFKEKGFINYYGMQRFGATSSSTHFVGRAILQKNWKEAVDLILSGMDENARGTIARAQRAWRRSRDPQEAYATLTGRQQRTTIEGRVLHTLCTRRGPKLAYLESLDRLPANSRQLYVHAFQSWLWNRLVSRRLRQLGMRPVPGDLVLCGEPSCDTEPEVSAPEDDGAGGGDWSAAPTALPAVKALTEADLEQYTIYDVVMPLPGWAVTLPTNASDWYREMLEDSDVTLSREHCDTLRQFSLAGAYRHVITRPSHVQWRMQRYSESLHDLLASDLDSLREREPPPADDPSGAFRALILQFRLPSSSYATMALREITGTDSSMATQARLNEAYKEEEDRLKEQRRKEQRCTVSRGQTKQPDSDETAVSTGETATECQAEKRDLTDDAEEPETKRQKT